MLKYYYAVFVVMMMQGPSAVNLFSQQPLSFNPMISNQNKIGELAFFCF